MTYVRIRLLYECIDEIIFHITDLGLSRANVGRVTDGVARGRARVICLAAVRVLEASILVNESMVDGVATTLPPRGVYIEIKKSMFPPDSVLRRH